MTVIYLTLLFFLLVVFTHAITLLYARHHRGRPYRWRKRLWRLHFWMNGSLWVFLAVWIILLQFQLPHFNYPFLYRVIGVSVGALGLTLTIVTNFTLGFRRAMGLRFFFLEKDIRIENFLYRFLNNPMYDGFILMLVGLGLWRGIVEDFYLALASFILLNLFLATIENQGYKWKPF